MLSTYHVPLRARVQCEQPESMSCFCWMKLVPVHCLWSMNWVCIRMYNFFPGQVQIYLRIRVSNRLYYFSTKKSRNSLMLHKSKKTDSLIYKISHPTLQTAAFQNCILCMFFILAIVHLFCFPFWSQWSIPKEKGFQMKAVHWVITMLKVNCLML